MRWLAVVGAVLLALSAAVGLVALVALVVTGGNSPGLFEALLVASTGFGASGLGCALLEMLDRQR